MDISTLNPEEAACLDAPYWLMLKQIRVDGMPFDLKGRGYQQEIMRPTLPDGRMKHNEVIRKGSQIGVTICKVAEAAHGAMFGLYPQGIIFYFPSQKAVEVFSKSRFKPFIEDNPDINRRMGQTDSITIRRLNKTNIYFFGGGATSRVAGEKKDSTSVRSTPADWVIVDERDLFDDDMARQINQRLGNSKIRRRTDIGTPTIPEFGVDALYRKSDQRRWQIPCECRKFTCIESEFPACFARVNEKWVPSCIHCGKPIDPAMGVWVPDFPDRDTVGYWPSQLLNPNCNYDLLLKQYEDPEAYDLDPGEYKRTVLGIPHVDEDDALSEPEIYAACGHEAMPMSDKGPCAMGVDVGNPIYCVIGHRLDKRFRIIRVCSVQDWGGLHDLIKRYNVRSTVIDAQPEYHKVREFQAAHGNIHLCYYSEHQKTFDSWDQQSKIVKVNRTEVFDATCEMIRSGKTTLPRMCEEMKRFAYQMTRSVRVLETDDRTGAKIYRYRVRGDKEDHYRNAMNYFYLACKKVGSPATAASQKRRQSQQDTGYKLGVL